MVAGRSGQRAGGLCSGYGRESANPEPRSRLSVVDGGPLATFAVSSRRIGAVQRRRGRCCRASEAGRTGLPCAPTQAVDAPPGQRKGLPDHLGVTPRASRCRGPSQPTGHHDRRIGSGPRAPPRRHPVRVHAGTRVPRQSAPRVRAIPVAQQCGAFVVIADQVPPVHSVFATHVGQEASEPDGSPRPPQGGIAVFVERS